MKHYADKGKKAFAGDTLLVISSLFFSSFNVLVKTQTRSLYMLRFCNND
jgi:hypothetical protein